MRASIALLGLLLTACTASATLPSTTSAAYPSYLEGYSGTELCYGCRLQREVTLDGGRSVLSQSDSACSEWVTEHAPNHVHEWTPIGCWSTDKGVACHRSAWPLLVSSEQWLAYLQCLPEGLRDDVIVGVAGGKEGPLRECQAWAARATASRSP